jgi:hypothetical protein
VSLWFYIRENCDFAQMLADTLLILFISVATALLGEGMCKKDQ